MMTNKNANNTLARKSTNNVIPKQHSIPFYISNSLFHNRRLKQKRFKWAASGYKRKNAALKADITIDLLTDDEADCIQSQCKEISTEYNTPHHKAQRQQIIIYPTQVQLAQLPKLNFIPVQQFPLQTFEKRINCKRKSRPPKRLDKPTIVNNESIVLSDSEPETIVENNNATKLSQQPQTPSNGPYITKVAQVEEVTVSLVPRTSGGSCTKPTTSELFPMAPDETTVHTIIANRIYELPLNKLREGLVSCSASDPANDNSKSSPTTSSNCTKVNSPVAVASPQPPVSLKLSSDLSISLISDDEDDLSDETAESLLRQQPHLSVQQFHIPVIDSDNHEVPKRRKLG